MLSTDESLRLRGAHDLAWRDYRRRRNVLLALYIGMLPGVIIIDQLTSRWGRSDTAFYLGVAVLFALFAVAHLRLALFPCPNCGRAFFFRWWGYNALVKYCVHCGHKKWT